MMIIAPGKITCAVLDADRSLGAMYSMVSALENNEFKKKMLAEIYAVQNDIKSLAQSADCLVQTVFELLEKVDA